MENDFTFKVSSRLGQGLCVCVCLSVCLCVHARMDGWILRMLSSKQVGLFDYNFFNSYKQSCQFWQVGLILCQSENLNIACQGHVV